MRNQVRLSCRILDELEAKNEHNVMEKERKNLGTPSTEILMTINMLDLALLPTICKERTIIYRCSYRQQYYGPEKRTFQIPA